MINHWISVLQNVYKMTQDLLTYKFYFEFLIQLDINRMNCQSKHYYQFSNRMFDLFDAKPL